MVFLISAVLVMIIILLGIPLGRQRSWKEFMVFMLILSLAGYLMYAQVLGWFAPNPTDLIKYITPNLL